jgi:hypothetical protein
MGLHPKAIVYLTLTPEKKLDEKKSIMSLENIEEIKELKSLIIPVSVIDKPASNNFLDGFIKKCLEITEDKNKLAKVYYDQYYKLLKSLGGDSMAMESYVFTMRNIFDDKEKLEAFRAFGALWNKRQEVIFDVIGDYLKEKENGFNDYPNERSVYKEFNKDVSIGFCMEDLAFGFVWTPGSKGFDIETQEKLELIWDDNRKLKGVFVENSQWKNDS